MKQMALILQGGGALGAFEYGAVTRLVELGWQPKAVTGVSIGAINAAAIAGAFAGDINASLDRVWQAITMPEVPWLPPAQQAGLSLFGNPNFYRPRTDYANLPHWNSLCNTTPMYATLNRCCDFNQINDASHMRFAVTATDLQSGAPTTFANHLIQAPRIDADGHRSHQARIAAAHIMASGSLPPGFPATEIDGQHYWDGGLFSNTPIDALLNMLEPDDIASLPIFVIDLFPSGGLPVPANLLDVQARMVALQYQNRFWAQYGGSGRLDGFIGMLNELDSELPEGSTVRKRAAFAWLTRLRALKNLRVIQAQAPTLTGASDFSPYGVMAAREAGRDAVDQYFANQPKDKSLRVAA